ncbi:MAG: ion channel, partial [Alcanivoracaceae bacterium]
MENIGVITFTTVGFGDVVIDKFWRLMAGIQALNGIMLLGWSTAVLMAMAQKIWQSSQRDGGTFSG